MRTYPSIGRLRNDTLRTAEDHADTVSTLGTAFAASYPADEGFRTTVPRYLQLLDTFRSRFGEGECFLARAPGRINLIGEHTDYNGCPVLPMAVDRDIAAVVRPRRDRKILVDSMQEGFGRREFQVDTTIPAFETGDWGNYPKAAVQWLLGSTMLGGSSPPSGAGSLHGYEMLIHGTIPADGGMSSSSALVVLSALALLASNDVSADRLELAQGMAEAERYVGTQGGGMDQAASLNGVRDHALRIDFHPLSVTSVPMPAGYSFVVTHSLVRAAKTQGAMDRYNRRSAECRMATALIAKAIAGMARNDPRIHLIGDLTPARTGLPAETLTTVPDTAVKPSPYSIAELAEALGCTEDTVVRRFCTRRDGSRWPIPAEGFKLRERLRHVLEEWSRVEQSHFTLQDGRMKEFGRLMDASHSSCRDLFEISCPELDALTEAARRMGALGSRLTGAGFGGCAISLLPDDAVDGFLSDLIDEYYGEKVVTLAAQAGLPDPKELSPAERRAAYGSVAFAVKAAAGAEAIPPTPSPAPRSPRMKNPPGLSSERSL